MNNLSQTGKWTILVVVIVVAVVLIAVYGGGSGNNAPVQTGANGTTNATVSDNGSMPATGTMDMNMSSPSPSAKPGTSNTGAGSGGSGTAGTVKSAITLVTPVPGDTWIATLQNPIQWSKAAGVSGQIDLLSATTSQLVGVILNEIGPAQTSYTWNTRDLLVSRTSPSKLTVVPGRYLIRISFDGNNLPSITSQPFTIVADTSTVQ